MANDAFGLLADHYVLLSQASNLAWAGVGLFLFIAVLRLLDRRAGLDFRSDIVPLLEGDAKAVAIYLGARFLGVALLVGQLVS